MNPYADFTYDGVLLNPMEVVFVKVKSFQQEANWGSARLAATYSRWMAQEVRALPILPGCMVVLDVLHGWPKGFAILSKKDIAMVLLGSLQCVRASGLLLHGAITKMQP